MVLDQQCGPQSEETEGTHVPADIAEVLNQPIVVLNFPLCNIILFLFNQLELGFLLLRAKNIQDYTMVQITRLFWRGAKTGGNFSLLLVRADLRKISKLL